MKSQNEVYNEKLQLNEQTKYLQKQLGITQCNLINLQNECKHELALAFDDRVPHIYSIITCVCPACGKREDIIHYCHEINESIFNESKIIDLTTIDLTNLSWEAFDDYLFNISEHIFNNYDYYYNNNISEDEMAKSILEVIDSEGAIKINSKILKKNKSTFNDNF